MPRVTLKIVRPDDAPANQYTLEIEEVDGPGKVTVDPADARDLIAELERHLGIAATIEAERLGGVRGPSSNVSGEPPSPVHGSGEGPQ